MTTDFAWDAPPLDPADARLVDAYRSVGKPVDQLPYTPDFDRIVAAVGAPQTNEAKHQLLMRLINLRKSGRLPRLGLLVD